jgi:hypothetical protein
MKLELTEEEVEALKDAIDCYFEHHFFDNDYLKAIGERLCK